MRAKIKARITRIRETGNLGVYEPLDGGVYEIKFYFGSGYRIYFGIEGNTMLLLLLGGDKGSQEKDINKAKKYWENHISQKKVKNGKVQKIQRVFN